MIRDSHNERSSQSDDGEFTALNCRIEDLPPSHAAVLREWLEKSPAARRADWAKKEASEDFEVQAETKLDEGDSFRDERLTAKFSTMPRGFRWAIAAIAAMVALSFVKQASERLPSHADFDAGAAAAQIAPAPSSRIVNFSSRAVAGPGNQASIIGFVVSGDNKNLLVRGIGPALTSFGVSNALADPLLTVFKDKNVAFATNDDWQIGNDGVLIAATAARVGAFALPDGSKDSAILVTVNNGSYTAGLVRPNSTGIALAEVYDPEATDATRLKNVSARMQVGTGENILIVGVVIAGDIPKAMLIRGIGPTLAAFGVAGVLADPKISVYSGSTLIATNDNWETGTSTAQLIAAAAALDGAFALPASSKDAALVVTLPPGSYIGQVSGVANTTGVALVEIYFSDLPRFEVTGSFGATSREHFPERVPRPASGTELIGWTNPVSVRPPVRQTWRRRERRERPLCQTEANYPRANYPRHRRIWPMCKRPD